MTEQFTNPRTGAWVRPLEGEADLTIERLMKPGTGKADAHVHFDFDERFEVLEGTGTIVVDRRERELAAGESVELPRRTPHRNLYNPGSEDLRFRLTLSPRTEFADAFLSALRHHMERGTVNAQGEFPNLQLLATLHGTRAKSYLAGPPIWLQKPVLPVGALIARLRGYRPRYD